MEVLLHSIRFAFRQMRRNPVTTLVVVVTLALGTGVNVAIFSVVDAVMLRPLPYPQPDELVAVWEARRGGRDDIPIADGNLLDVYLQKRTLAGFAAYGSSPTLVTVGDSTVRATVAAVSRDFFSVFRAEAAAGRVPASEEFGPGAPAVAVVGHPFAQSVLGGGANAVGRQISLFGSSATVVGVMPAGFAFPAEAEIWVDAERYVGASRTAHNFKAVGRLAPETSLEQAASDLDAIAAGLRAEHGNEIGDDFAFAVRPLHDDLVGDSGSTLVLLLAVVGAVLLIACGNIAGILLARTVARYRELGIRQALGAHGADLALQLVVETLILGLLGAVLGLLLARWSLGLLRAWVPPQMLHSGGVAIDGRVIGGALALGLATGLVCSLGPVWRVLRRRPADDLKTGPLVAVRGGRTRRVGGLLVVPQYALSLAALVLAGLMLKSLWLLVHVEPGFRTAGLVTVGVTLPATERYAEPSNVSRHFRQVAADVAAVPGVSGVTLAHTLPLSGESINGVALREGDPLPDGGDYEFYPDYRPVGAGYFSSLGIELLRGRGFTPADDETAAPVAVLSESLARQMWPGASPLGERVVLPGLDFDDAESERALTVVGVVADIRHAGLDRGPIPAVYVPWPQHLTRARSLHLVAAVEGRADRFAGAVREAVRARDPGLPLGPARTIESLVRSSTAEPRFRAGLLSLFAGLALLLALLGLYGVTSYALSKRRREVAIRLAVGASRQRIQRLLLREALVFVIAGQVLGTVIAVASGRLLGGLLFGVETTDLAVLAVTSVSLAAVALLTTYVPSRRASRIDASRMLHQE
jgi:predicted permease